MLPGIFIGYALNSGEGWTRDLVIVDWHDFDNNVASEVHVMRFKSEGVGIKKMQEVFTSPGADGSLRQEGHAQRRTACYQRAESFDAERVPTTLGEVKGDRLQSAGSDSWEEEGGVADFSEADRDALEAREAFWSMSTVSCPENNCMYRKSHNSQIRLNTLTL